MRAIAWLMQHRRFCSIMLPALAALAALAGCNSQPRAPAPPEPTAEPQLVLPAADPPMDREALILAATRAASDWSAGARATDEQRQLDGKRFELKLRFGCVGDRSTSGSWTFDEQERVLRVEADAEISAATPLLADLAIGGFEAAEGFWLHRPWMLEAECPAMEPPAAPADDVSATAKEAGNPPAPPTVRPWLGIAQFYTDQDSRTARREARAYEATLMLDQDERPSARGYDLVLSGRLVALADGRVIACGGPSGSPPSCVISARFDRAALAEPGGEELARWFGN